MAFLFLFPHLDGCLLLSCLTCWPTLDEWASLVGSHLEGHEEVSVIVLMGIGCPERNVAYVSSK